MSEEARTAKAKSWPSENY